MIEVVLNDRLGKKVRVKCNEDDTIGDLKKLAAAQLGTRPEKLKIQKWHTVYKDHITLEDYEIHDVSTLPVTVTNTKCVLQKYPSDGEKFNAEENVKFVSEPLLLGNTKDPSNPAAGGGASSCGPNDVIVKVETLSVDAFIRTMIKDPTKSSFHGNVHIGSTIPAIGYGTIVAAGQRSGWSVGSVVIGMLGAQTYAKITTGGGSRSGGPTLSSKLSLPWTSPTSSLGLFGLTTGLTAYVGVFCVCSRPPRKGETVVVTAAAGAVGSIAAQLAKLTGARVIGIAGNKNDYLINDLKLDGAINYKAKDKTLEEQLESTCPDGIDFVFDNVGGEVLDALLHNIRPKGRIVICGAVSQYENPKTYGPSNYIKLAERGAEMKGFTVLQYTSQLPVAIFFLWWYSAIRGKVKMTESVNAGIKTFPSALQKIFSGGNIGKTLVTVE